ncbi:MAG TPA: nucleotide sugar dehydrogenase [Terriglobia bacterium]|nr:nucleotide sugar dehydrogenase [Terriglobia bacterium]
MRIAVFGLGYVGCVTGACLARLGHDVYGVDISATKVGLINAGEAPLREKGIERLVAQVVRAGKFRASLDAREAVERAQVSLVCVGTPSRPNGDADVEHVLKAVTEIGAALRRRKGGHSVAVRSTIPPGTMERVVIPALERSARRKAGAGLHVAFHPEFLREGSSVEDFFHPSRTVIGLHNASGARQWVKLWRPIPAPLYLTSLGVAEMLKYADNAFHALKVAFANEIGALAKKLEIDGREVMRIFVDDRKLNLSPRYLRPGFAFGGPCLPKDLRALTRLARRHGLEAPLISGVLESNRRHLDRARELVLATGQRRIGVLGLVFKSDTDDLRESPACQLVKELVAARRAVKVYDPQVDVARLVGANRAYVESELPVLPRLMAASLDDLVASSDVIVIAGTHQEFATVPRKLRRNQTVIDLVGLLGPAPASRVLVEGLCW